MDKDGGGFDAAPPPVGGLGNFKGVMLCNRPVDGPNAHMRGGHDGDPPFKSMISATENEQLGLRPCKTFERTVKKRGPSAALRRHVRWLKELQDQMREERDQIDIDVVEEEEKKRRMKAVYDKHREGVREMMQERERSRALPKEAPPPKAQNATKKSAAKPLWAMTEREKDDFEDEEADDLINFAENLDFEKYVGDLEFRQGLEVMKDRAGRLQKEQDAFKDALVRDFNAKAEDEDEGRSTSAGSPRSKLEDGVDGRSLFDGSEYSSGSSGKRSRGEERYGADRGWDSSTNCGDDRPAVSREVKQTAEAVLESNPQMRAIHSKESVQRIIEKARERQAQEEPVDLVEHMRREGAVPVPVITSSSDTQVRLHKPVEPSLLPYLYRSPAI